MRSPAKSHANSKAVPPGVFASDQKPDEAQEDFVAGDTLDGGHQQRDAQSLRAPVDLDPGQVVAEHHLHRAGVDRNGDRRGNENHLGRVAVSEGNGHCGREHQGATADPSDVLLLILADALDDLERTRISNENRLRSLRQVKGLEGSKAEAKLEVVTDGLAGLEHSAELELKRALRTHPLGRWVKQTVGIGEKQGARLIAAIGDPGWNHADDRPRRGPAELWAYCGYAPGQKRRKGVKSNWNAQAKMRAYLCAESCMKQRSSPYRVVYDQARANWADRETSDGHKHAHGLRCVAKAILKDLWLEARANGFAVPMPRPPASESQDHSTEENH